MTLCLGIVKLVTPSIGRNAVGEGGAKALAEALVENDTLRWLELGSFPRENRIIGSNAIGDSGAKSLAAALFKNHTLDALFLGSLTDIKASL